MAIRKHGQVTGVVTGVDQDGISTQAARQDWDDRDDQALADENLLADGGHAAGDDD